MSVVSEIDIIVRSKVPVFGICMGHQLLAITLGAKTIKMDIGHRGSNHPVYDISSGKVEISSQNHGFVLCTYSKCHVTSNKAKSNLECAEEKFQTRGWVRGCEK
jgi:carbamoylphosphate synthase small subunit